VRPGGAPFRTETVGGATVGEGPDRVLVVPAPGRAPPGRDDLSGTRIFLTGVPVHAGRVGQLVIGEEPGLPVADGHHQVVADVAVIVEEEQPDVILLGMPVDGNLVAQRGAGLDRAAVVGQLAAEQPVDALAAGPQVHSEPADKQQVRLPGLDHDPGRHAPGVVQVPGVQTDIGLGPYRAGPHRTGRPLDAGHAVCQQQRRGRHPGLPSTVVLNGEHRPEQFGDVADRQPFKLGPAEPRTRQ